MKISSIAFPLGVAIFSQAEELIDLNTEFTPFDKSKLAPTSFFEQFNSDDWSDLWKISRSKRNEEFAYNGEWSVEESIAYSAFKNDRGLVLKTPAAHHAISAKLPHEFDNNNNTLALQYEVKTQEGLKCGGAYLKLLNAGSIDDNNEFDSDTPYQVMFGPDRCGSNDQIHFIVRRFDKDVEKVIEKHLKFPPRSIRSNISTLYTLIIEPNQNFQIRINGEVVKYGNLLEKGTFQPEFIPPKHILDPEDIKPETWDDRLYILDPDFPNKPDDWDEQQPFYIEDPNDKIPEGWLIDEPKLVIDENALKPEEWDDEEDGEWIAPSIPNPKCEVGCGIWKPKFIENPKYKGNWVQPEIENPNYQGEWVPRSIENPNYFEDNPSNLEEKVGYLGFELWSIENNIFFDNIYLGHSIAEAELIGNETFIPKYLLEKNAISQALQKEKPLSESNVKDSKDVKLPILTVLKTELAIFLANGRLYADELRKSPWETLSQRPIEAFTYGGILASLTSLVLSIWSIILNAVVPRSPISNSSYKRTPKESEIIGNNLIKESVEETGIKVNETEAFNRKLHEAQN
ncbi:hypothetical protein WICMUC_004144 [Wickerhamomyces mucosus]|uniref:Calnexin n=1 Tax=Wickerhamomyces mucosus TaxID=1378264 RepID=A0A9P8TAT4_9ASCO|nr:hypothetical protein WICMUC_004144 [Wickerhamomyces mucosus]